MDMVTSTWPRHPKMAVRSKQEKKDPFRFVRALEHVHAPIISMVSFLSGLTTGPAASVR